MPNKNLSPQATLALLPPDLLRQNIELGLVQLDVVDEEGKTIVHHIATSQDAVPALAAILESIKAMPETSEEQAKSAILALLTKPDNSNTAAFQYAAWSFDLLNLMMPYIPLEEQRALIYTPSSHDRSISMMRTASKYSPQALELLLGLVQIEHISEHGIISLLECAIAYGTSSIVLDYIPQKERAKYIKLVFRVAVQDLNARRLFLAELTEEDRIQVILNKKSNGDSVLSDAAGLRLIDLLHALPPYERMYNIIFSPPWLHKKGEESDFLWNHSKSSFFTDVTPAQKLELFKRVIAEDISEDFHNRYYWSDFLSPIGNQKFLASLLQEMNGEQLVEFMQVQLKKYEDRSCLIWMADRDAEACAVAVEHVLEHCTAEQILILLKPILLSISNVERHEKTWQIICSKITTKLSEQQCYDLLVETKVNVTQYEPPRTGWFGEFIPGAWTVKKMSFVELAPPQLFSSLMRLLPSYWESKEHYSTSDIIKALNESVGLATYSYGENNINRGYHARSLDQQRITQVISAHPSADFSFLQTPQYQDKQGQPLSSDSLKRIILGDLKKQIQATQDQTQLDTLLNEPETKAKILLLECKQGITSSIFNLQTSSSKALAAMIELHKKPWEHGSKEDISIVNKP